MLFEFWSHYLNPLTWDYCSMHSLLYRAAQCTSCIFWPKRDSTGPVNKNKLITSVNTPLSIESLRIPKIISTVLFIWRVH